MDSRFRRHLLAAGFALLALATAPSAASAQFYSIANVDAQSWPCLLSSTCSLSYTQTTSSFMVPGVMGEGFLHSRTYPVTIDPGFGPSTLWFYEYRIDLSGMEPTIDTSLDFFILLSVDHNPVQLIDLDGNGTPDQVFVLASGGPGSIGPFGALPFGIPANGQIYGLGMHSGQGTYFFGFASLYPPSAVPARLEFSQIGVLGGIDVSLVTRGPGAFGVLRADIFQELEVSIAALDSDDCVEGGTVGAKMRRIRAMQSRLSEAERLAAADRLMDAVVTLANLRSRIDGIGDDWVPLPPDPCAEPVREITDALIARLQGRPLHLPLPGVCMQDPTGGP